MCIGSFLRLVPRWLILGEHCWIRISVNFGDKCGSLGTWCRIELHPLYVTKLMSTFCEDEMVACSYERAEHWLIFSMRIVAHPPAQAHNQNVYTKSSKNFLYWQKHVFLWGYRNSTFLTWRRNKKRFTFSRNSCWRGGGGSFYPSFLQISMDHYARRQVVLTLMRGN